MPKRKKGKSVNKKESTYRIEKRAKRRKTAMKGGDINLTKKVSNKSVESTIRKDSSTVNNIYFPSHFLSMKSYLLTY